jgi:hypothetical protein
VDEILVLRGELPPTDSMTRAKIAAMTWPETVCWLGARLADALAYAHAHGVLHRDLKPANVLLGADASPRLADFNVSSCSVVVGDSPTVGGSLAYMSPEQLEAFDPSRGRSPESLDGRSDIYSLGLTLWELLTGSRPFAAPDAETGPPTVTSMVARQRSGIAAKAELELPADLTGGLREVLEKCLQADPNDRYTTAGEVARRLDLCRKPRSRELLLPSPGWRTWAAKHPLFLLYAIGLGVNGFASVFSILYNGTTLVDPIPGARETFDFLLIVINGFFFPVCIVLFGFAIWPVVRGLRRVGHEPLTPAELAAIRRRCLRLGPLSVQVCLWAWVAAGVLFPLALHYMVRELPAAFHVHFLASQTLCGLIAVSYPEFMVTFIALRAFYPKFVENAALTADDLAQVRRIERQQGVYLVLAVSIPLLAIGLLASIGGERRPILGFLSFVGLVGFGIAYWLTGAIRADRVALEEAVSE